MLQLHLSDPPFYCLIWCVTSIRGLGVYFVVYTINETLIYSGRSSTRSGSGFYLLITSQWQAGWIPNLDYMDCSVTGLLYANNRSCGMVSNYIHDFNGMYLLTDIMMSLKLLFFRILSFMVVHSFRVHCRGWKKCHSNHHVILYHLCRVDDIV